MLSTVLDKNIINKCDNFRTFPEIGDKILIATLIKLYNYYILGIVKFNSKPQYCTQNHTQPLGVFGIFYYKSIVSKKHKHTQSCSRKDILYAIIFTDIASNILERRRKGAIFDSIISVNEFCFEI